MDSKEKFKQEKIAGREEIKNNVIKVLKDLSPIALHQFGSGARESGDEFSDLDFFVTIADEKFDQLVSSRETVFLQVAPILIQCADKVPNPAGWYHDLIIHESEKGLFHVDYYLTPRSIVILPPNAKLLYGEDGFPSGEWSFKAEPEKGDLTGLYEGILVMSFIGVKGIVRGWDREFFNYLRSLYKDFQEQTGDLSLGQLPTENDYSLIYSILNNLQSVGEERQKNANRKVHEYALKVEHLYFSKL